MLAQLESTLTMMITGIETASFGHVLIFAIWISENLVLLIGEPSAFKLCPLEDSASHFQPLGQRSGDIVITGVKVKHNACRMYAIV